MAISGNKNDRQKDSLIESTVTPGQVARAIVNPDGTNVGGGTTALPPTDGSGSTPSVVSVGTSSTEIVALNTDRKWAVVSNVTKNSTVWLSIGVAAVVGSGMPIRENGFLRINRNNYTTEAINGIVSSGTINVSFQEIEEG